MIQYFHNIKDALAQQRNILIFLSLTYVFVSLTLTLLVPLQKHPIRRPVVRQWVGNQNPLNTLPIMKLPGSLNNRAILEKKATRTGFVLIAVGCLQKCAGQGTEKATQSPGLLPGWVPDLRCRLPSTNWSGILALSLQGGCQRGQVTQFFHWVLLRRLGGGGLFLLCPWIPGLTSHYLKRSFQVVRVPSLLRGQNEVIILLLKHILG